MKTEKELNTDIMDITMKIEATHPELSKFIGEMPVKMTNAEGTEAGLKNLRDYHNTLLALLTKYDISHHPDTGSISS